MKILIACDMEGISGVISWDHVDSSHAEYPRFRRIMTADVNAAIAGAAAAGADDILVADGHAFGSNILIEELDPRARLNCGVPSPFAMVQGIQTGVDAVFFIGYHARMGTPHAILDHTWSSRRVSNVWLNGRLTGEIGLNAAVCGHFNAPVLLLSGDQSACAEARDFLPGVETVQVKKAAARMAAECLPPAVSQALIRAGAEKAVDRFIAGEHPAPFRVDPPVTITIEFYYSLMADAVEVLPGARRLDGRRIEFTAADMPAAYSAFRAAVSLAGV